ncbi:DMT family transporter [Candidatus Micrarchaeota archaeon]|nr:DMT family transporter [Candidatus Micrarchaeota archaeon]
MDWLLLAVLSAVVLGVNSLVIRRTVKNGEPIALAIVDHVVGAIVFASIVLLAAGPIVWPTQPIAYAVMVFGGIAWALGANYVFRSFKANEVSLNAPLTKTSLVWTLLLGVLWLNESAGAWKIIGTVLIMLGALALSFDKKLLGKLKEIGVRDALLAAFFLGIAYVFDKKGLEYFDFNLYVLSSFLIPLALFLLFVKKPIGKTRALLKNAGKSALLVAFLDMVWYALMMLALKTGESSQVSPILQLSLIVSVVGGVIVFGEKKDLMQKIIGSAAVLLGAILVVS